MHEPDDYECPFCRIAAGHLPERVVHRTDDVMVLVNIRWWPNNPGACLVVPIEHHENVYSLPPELGTPLQYAIRDTALALKAAYGCDGVSTRQHNEPAGNQDVWHHHTHVFPRFHDDGLYRLHGSTVPIDEVNRAASLLREHWPPYTPWSTNPPKPLGAGVLFRDGDGRILVVEPTYKDPWEIPGGAVERHETPRQAARREVREELGLDVEPGALLCVDHRDTAPEPALYVFGGPTLTTEQIAAIRLPPDELRSFRFVEPEEAYRLLNPRLARRLESVLAGAGVYLENGTPIA